MAKFSAATAPGHFHLKTTSTRPRSRAFASALVAMGLLMSLLSTTPASAVTPPNNGDSGIWGGVDRFNSGVDDDKELFRDIVIIDDRVYAGGFFTNVRAGAGGNRTDQAFLAAYDRYTGRFITTFRPQFDGPILEVEASPDGKSLFVGGDFEHVNGQAVAGFVTLDPYTGEIQDFGVSVNWVYSGILSIDALTVEGDWLYIGGNLTHITDSTGVERFRNRIGRVSLSTGRLDGNFRPLIAGGRVATIEPDVASGRVYIGGQFTRIGNDNEAGFVAVHHSDGSLISGITQGQQVEFRIDHFPYDIEVFPGYVAYAGDMELIIKRSSDLATVFQWRYGSYPSGTCRPDGDVQAIEYVDGHLYFGGHFTDIFSNQGCSLAGNNRRPLGRWDPATGNLDSSYYNTPFDAVGANPSIWGLVADDAGVIWLGGVFTRVGSTTAASLSRLTPSGVDRTRPAAISGLSAPNVTDSTVDLTWNASSDASGITGYEIYMTSPAGFAQGERGELVQTLNTTSATIVGLDLDTEYVFQVRAIDGAGNPGVLRRLNAQTSNQLSITNPGDQRSPLNQALTLNVQATSSSGLAITYGATPLPDGLVIDSATGVISGTPTALADVATLATATDSNGLVRETTFRWQVLDGTPPTIDPIADQVTSRDQATSLTPQTNGGDTHSATGLPTGITIDTATGVMTGTPTAGGTFNVTYTAENAFGFTTERSFIWRITAPLVEVIVSDDFESNAGWNGDPYGTDDAHRGIWSFGSPSEKTSGGYVVQPGTVTSGTNALVTDPSGGAAGTGDVDGGTTSVLSPVYNIPADALSARLEFDYYGGITYRSAHANDWVRISIIDGQNSEVIAQKIGPSRQSAVWEHVNADISAYKGRNIQVLVQAADGDNPGGWVEAGIDTLSITITRGAAPVVPDAPASCEATLVNGDVSVTWPAANGAVEYIVYRAVDGGNSFWRGKTAGTEFIDTVRGSTMDYAVLTVGADGVRSSTTDCGSLVVTPPVAPVAPASCDVALNGALLNVEWPAANGAAEYVVYRSVDGGLDYWRGKVSTTEFEDSSRDGTLQYSVRSVSASGQRSDAVPCNPVNPAPVTVTPVAACTLTQSGSDVEISWTANGAAEYVIYRSIDGGNEFWRGKVTGSTFDDTLRSGTTTYLVAAKDGTQQSARTTCGPDAQL